MKYLIAALFAVASSFPLNAGIYFLRDFQNGTTQPTVLITTKIDMNILTSGAVKALTFDNWMIWDEIIVAVYNAANAQTLSLGHQINYGPTDPRSLIFFGTKSTLWPASSTLEMATSTPKGYLLSHRKCAEL